MTKEEKIQEAYGDCWEYLHVAARKCALKNNGWISQIIEHAPDELDLEFENMAYRPKSLQGIENNNGWIKIESEEDLPKSVNVMYRIGMFLNDGRFHQDKNLCNHKTALEALSWNYTHYQAVTESYPPIY